MIQPNIAKQKKSLYLIIGIGLLILLIANALGWIYLQRIKSFFISDLRFRLENIGNVSARLIDAGDLTYLIPEDTTSPEYIFYQNLLFDLKENNNLQDIYLISPAMETLIDLSPDITGIEHHQIPDKSLVEKAMSGQTIVGDIQILGDHKFLTAITPLIDTDNNITGLLVIEASAEFFDMLDQFDRGLLIFSFFNAFLILTVALYLIRSIKKILQLQNLIKNQEHLVALGEMAATVAHEVRNPLGIINGTNALIQKKYGKASDEIFTYIPAELKRLNNLIENFLTFARNRSFNYQSVDMVDLIKQIEVGVSEHENIEIRTEIPEDLPKISSDRNALEQVLLNIINNSIQSMDEGKIIIRCELSGHKFGIYIIDNGPGISPDVMDRIFDPFFTTREQGSGLGLAISQKLVNQLDGTLTVHSNPDKGTTVTILFNQ